MSSLNSPQGGGSQLQQQDQSSAVQASDEDQQPGNAKVPEASGKGAGLANYKATLGKWLGPKLYDAVSKQITQAKLAKYADSAVKGGLKSLANKLGSLDASADPAAVDMFAQALVKQFGGVAGSWVASEGEGLTKALNGFVDANPVTIVTLALLAAAGAVAADVAVPQLKKSFNVSKGLDAELAIKLGTIRNLALEKIEAKIKYQSGKVSAVWTGEYEDDMFKTGLDLGYKATDKLDLGLHGRWDEDNGASASLDLKYQATDNLSFGANASMSGKDKRVGIGMKWRF